jgi:cell division protein FtsL
VLRTHFILIAVLLASAIALVSAQHRSRTLHTQLEREHAHMRVLETEHGQLQIEQGTLAAHARIAALAETRLHMKTPARDGIIVIESAVPSP